MCILYVILYFTVIIKSNRVINFNVYFSKFINHDFGQMLVFL